MQFGNIRSNLDDFYALLTRTWVWWIGELWSLLPRGIREKLAVEQEQLAVDVTGGLFVVRAYQAGSHREVYRCALDGVEESNLLVEIPATLSMDACVLHIPAKEVLYRKVVLPLAAFQNLKSILTHELDRQSPVDPAEVYFDHRVVSKDKASNRLEVELRLVKRITIERAVDICRAQGVMPAEIEFVDINHNALGTRFVIDRPQLLRRRLRSLLTPFLAALVMFLVIATVHAALARREAMVEALVQQTAKLKPEAAISAKLKLDIYKAETRTKFLSDLKKAPLFVKTFSDVTRNLPDGSWLFGFEFNGREVRIRGYSPSASSLVQIFDTAPDFTKAQFRSPLTQGPSGKLERFDLSFEVKRDGQ